jgi:amidase
VKRIGRDRVTNVFGADQSPVADVWPGETIVFETLDAAGGRIRSVEDGLTVLVPRELGNPATGPVRVVGAKPGDTLAVTIIDIRLGAQGYSRFRAGGGVITFELRPPFAKIIPIRDGIVHFSERVRFPARPMVGVIGAAPAGAPVHSFYPGPHGGNLDVNAIAVGATVYLPVAVPGALLAIGDVHAHMGDGELTGGGIDIPAEVEVRVDLRSGLGWPGPVVETPDAWCTCANAPTLPEAVRLATSRMATLLAGALGMSREEAFVLIGCAGDARIGQAAELGMDATAYVQVSKAVLPNPFGSWEAPQ